MKPSHAQALFDSALCVMLQSFALASLAFVDSLAWLSFWSRPNRNTKAPTMFEQFPLRRLLQNPFKVLLNPCRVPLCLQGSQRRSWIHPALHLPATRALTFQVSLASSLALQPLRGNDIIQKRVLTHRASCVSAFRRGSGVEVVFGWT